MPNDQNRSIKNISYLGKGFECSEMECAEFITNILAIHSHLEPSKPLIIILNSYGSYDVYGWMIYDLLHSIKREIKIYAIGCCCSMAMLILQCASKGQRHVSAHIYALIHDGKDSWNFKPRLLSRNKINDERKFEYYEHFNQEYNNVLIQKIHEKQPSLNLTDFEKEMKHDTYFSATELINYGLADKIWRELPI